MTTVDEVLNSAFRCHQAGRLADAEGLYRRVLQARPDHVDALHLLGLVARKLGRAEQAVELIGRAVAVHPGFAEAHYNLGNALRAAGRLDEAVASYRRALALRPDDAQARDALDVALGRRDPLTRLARTLDREYRGGRWAYLAGLHEVARYGVVSGYVRHLLDRPCVLDLGCGEGNLFAHLPADRLAAYVGVDISQAALDRSRVRGANTRLACAPLERFAPEPGERFDAILFNEVLLYVADPAAAMRRYRPWLAPGGIMVVSYFRVAEDPTGAARRKEQELWAALDAEEWGSLDESVLVNGPQRLCWRIRALRPRPLPDEGAAEDAGAGVVP